MKTVLKSIALVIVLVMGTGLQAQEIDYALAWQEFTAEWQNRVSQDPAMEQAWQEVRDLLQEFTKIPYALSEQDKTEIGKLINVFNEDSDSYQDALVEIFEKDRERFVPEMKELADYLRVKMQEPHSKDCQEIAFCVDNCPILQAYFVVLLSKGLAEIDWSFLGECCKPKA